MKKDVKWVMIHDMTAVIGFILLAAIFEYWWIALFSLLFTRYFNYVKNDENNDK